MTQNDKNRESRDETTVGLADLLAIFIKKRWLIIIPTIVSILAVGGMYAAGLIEKRSKSPMNIFEKKMEFTVYNDYSDFVASYLSSPDLLSRVFIDSENPDSADGFDAKYPIVRVDWETKKRSLSENRSVIVRSQPVIINRRNVLFNLSAESEAALLLAVELINSSLDRYIQDYNEKIQIRYLEQVKYDESEKAAVEAYALFLAQQQIIVMPFKESEIAVAPVPVDLPKPRTLVTIVAAVFCLSIFAAFIVTWLQAFVKNEDNVRKLREALGRKRGKGAS